MATFSGQVANELSLLGQSGEAADRLYVDGLSNLAQFSPPQVLEVTPLLFFDTLGGEFEVEDEKVSVPWVVFGGHLEDWWNLGDVWFEIIHVLPRRLDLGNILTTIQEVIEIYNADRYDSHVFSAFTNTAGAGIDITDLPVLAVNIPSLSGILLTLEVSPDGPPNINGNLEFTFDLYTIIVELTGQRIVMFPIRPQAPLTERLEFLTNLLEHKDGSEQRISVRKSPRQVFEFSLALDGDERRYVENLLYDWQSRVFGLPVWTEPAFLTAPAAISDTVLAVDNTTLSDFRVGSLAIIVLDRKIFDAVEIASMDATSITASSPLTNNYPVGAQVLPLRTAVASRLVRGSRALVNDLSLDIEFRVTDNDVDLADVSGYSTFDGKLLLDDYNVVDRRMTESLERKLLELDSIAGVFTQSSPWARGKRISAKGLVSHSREELWETKALLYYMRGRQVSFYLPTFFDEMQVSQPLANASNTLTIENVGFARFVQNRDPRNVIRVHLVNGTILTRTITDSVEIDADEEQLTVDTVWPSDITIDEVQKIDYLELVRSDVDTFSLRHINSIGDASVSFPVRTVFE